jgi:hypothetical protein
MTLENKNVIEYARSDSYVQDLMWILNTLLVYPYYGGYVREDSDSNSDFAFENDFIYQFFQDQKTLLYTVLSVFHPKKKKIYETLTQFYEITKMYTQKYLETQETNTWRDFFEHVMDRQNDAQDQITAPIQNFISDMDQRLQDQIEDQIRDQIEDQIRDQIEDQIRDQIEDQIRDQTST